jgi:hypothetical protein
MAGIDNPNALTARPHPIDIFDQWDRKDESDFE